MSNPNSATSSASTVWKWAFSTLLGITISLGSYAFRSVDGRVQALENTRIPTAERMIALEVQVSGLRADVQRLEAAIKDQSQKIDQLGDRK